MKIDSTTKLFAVIGDPVSHSLSPAMHNAAFSHLGVNAAYVALHVKPKDIEDAITGVRSLGIAGLNVTIPHKQAVLPLMDELDETARMVGAVNTVVNREGRLAGYNTDAYGFQHALELLVGSTKGMKVVMLGAGGASLAVIHAFDESNEITILNRSVENACKVASLARKAKTKPLALDERNLEESLKRADLLVNATPLGLHGENPVKESLFRSDMAVFDLSYERQRATPLVAAARKKGANAADGKEMLLYQGVKAFELFTGKAAPIEVMRRAIEE